MSPLAWRSTYVVKCVIRRNMYIAKEPTYPWFLHLPFMKGRPDTQHAPCVLIALWWNTRLLHLLRLDFNSLELFCNFKTLWNFSYVCHHSWCWIYLHVVRVCAYITLSSQTLGLVLISFELTCIVMWKVCLLYRYYTHDYRAINGWLLPVAQEGFKWKRFHMNECNNV